MVETLGLCNYHYYCFMQNMWWNLLGTQVASLPLHVWLPRQILVALPIRSKPSSHLMVQISPTTNPDLVQAIVPFSGSSSNGHVKSKSDIRKKSNTLKITYQLLQRKIYRLNEVIPAIWWVHFMYCKLVSSYFYLTFL